MKASFSLSTPGASNASHEVGVTSIAGSICSVAKGTTAFEPGSKTATMDGSTEVTRIYLSTLISSIYYSGDVGMS